MKRMLLLGVLLLAGCQNVVGPFQRREPKRIDDPLLTIEEQRVRGRDRLALPEDRTGLAPNTYMDRPDPHGR
ncbi:MAG: hypothetical protein KatS3mg105_2691 [Gemmatales bacterium]|nr:MAG: hypothetical protein KatS3mg105_2691 [Gemmatales bacterium]